MKVKISVLQVQIYRPLPGCVPVNCCICITMYWRYGGRCSCITATPRYPQSNAPINKHSKQDYCNVVYLRGYPMSIIPVVICPYLPFSPTYEADNCIVVILSFSSIDCTWSQPLNRTFCQSSQLGTGLHCQFSRQDKHFNPILILR